MMEKSILNSKRNTDFGLYLSVGLLSTCLFISIYGLKVLDPGYTSWLLSGGDLTQHYLGWRAYRVSKWHFPIGMVDTLAYPNLTSIIFTDSIPLLAVPFKLISPLLPKDFQYFGLWGVGCFILQGIITVDIIKKYSNNRLAIILFSMLVELSPIIYARMFGHTALAGHFIILYGIGTIFCRERYRNNRKIFCRVAIMAIFSSSVHLYFVLMSGILLAGACLLDTIECKRIKRSIILLTEYVLISSVIVYLLGGFNSGMTAQNVGLGTFSYNLNGLINPQGWSCILKDIPLYIYEQYEGFAYLGLGFVFLITISIMLFASKRIYKHKEHIGIVITVLFVITTSIIVAASPVVTFGSNALFELNLPKLILDGWSVFRATGRIVWVAVYIMEISTFVLLSTLDNKTILSVLIGIALILQTIDIHVAIGRIKTRFDASYTYNTLLITEEFWDCVAQDDDIKHVVYCSQMELDYMYSITDWALDNKKTVNNFYFARPIDEVVAESTEHILREQPSDSMIVFSEVDKTKCSIYDYHYYNIDNMIIGYPKRISLFNEMTNEDLALE